jgi:hypothetical protein
MTSGCLTASDGIAKVDSTLPSAGLGCGVKEVACSQAPSTLT